jgi:AcrR family transcriptional regulator
MADTQGAHPSDTSRRLLDAAGEVFAKRGFRQATVREICRRAHANIAAVNYHFRDKDGLYAAVLREAQRAAREKYPPTLGLGPNASAEQRLHAFIRSFLLRLFDPGRPAWHGLLMARELVEPTAALDLIIEESVRPRYELLRAIVRELSDREISDERVRLRAQSIVGQCMYYHYVHRVLARLDPPGDGQALDPERLADHITEFSLAAMRPSAVSPRSSTS